MTDAMARLSNSIFQELDVFYSFRYIERQMNENFFLTHAEVHGSALQCFGDDKLFVILCDFVKIFASRPRVIIMVLFLRETQDF